MVESARCPHYFCIGNSIPSSRDGIPKRPKLSVGGDATNGVAHAARVAWELGCHVAKVPWTGDAASFAEVCSAVPIPVLIAGGPKNKPFIQTLEIVESAISSGASGVCMGRQVFSSSNRVDRIKRLSEQLCMKAQPLIGLPHCWSEWRMDLWLDITTLESEEEIDQEFQDQFGRLWTGSSSDVAVVQLDDFRGQEEAKSLIGMVEWILVRCSDWTMIPLENIIAAASGCGTKVAASISKEIEAQQCSLLPYNMGSMQ